MVACGWVGRGSQWPWYWGNPVSAHRKSESSSVLIQLRGSPEAGFIPKGVKTGPDPNPAERCMPAGRGQVRCSSNSSTLSGPVFVKAES